MVQQLVDLGLLLRRERDKRHLSLRDAEEVTGVSASTLSRMERGVGSFDLATISKVANWLEVAIDLVAEHPEPIVLTTPERITSYLLDDEALSLEHADLIAMVVRSMYAAFAKADSDGD